MRKIIGKISNEKSARVLRRKLSIRKKVVGTCIRPRVSIKKSNKNIYAQVIDDSASATIASCQTFGKNSVGNGTSVETAKLVGTKLAGILKEKKIDTVVYDRNGMQYCGAVAAIAESLRENGIKL